jgi:hypothetical protein
MSRSVTTPHIPRAISAVLRGIFVIRHAVEQGADLGVLYRFGNPPGSGSERFMA